MNQKQRGNIPEYSDDTLMKSDNLLVKACRVGVWLGHVEVYRIEFNVDFGVFLGR